MVVPFNNAICYRGNDAVSAFMQNGSQTMLALITTLISKCQCYLIFLISFSFIHCFLVYILVLTFFSRSGCLELLTLTLDFLYRPRSPLQGEPSMGGGRMTHSVGGTPTGTPTPKKRHLPQIPVAMRRGNRDQMTLDMEERARQLKLRMQMHQRRSGSKSYCCLLLFDLLTFLLKILNAGLTD